MAGPQSLFSILTWKDLKEIVKYIEGHSISFRNLHKHLLYMPVECPYS